MNQDIADKVEENAADIWEYCKADTYPEYSRQTRAVYTTLDILNVIRSSKLRLSADEIALPLNLSTQTVKHYLQALERSGRTGLRSGPSEDSRHRPPVFNGRRGTRKTGRAIKVYWLDFSG